MTETWLAIRMPKRPRSWRASVPAATREAVSRALARSSTSRTSVCPYFSAPARSAWPGRGRVTSARLAPVAPSGISFSTCIVCCQLTQSRLRMSIAIGAPVVRPLRTPGQDLGAVAFDLHAPAAAVAALAAPQLPVEPVDVDLEAGRHAVDGDDERLAVRLAGAEKSEHSRSFYTKKLRAPGARARALAGASAAARARCITHARGAAPR